MALDFTPTRCECEHAAHDHMADTRTQTPNQNYGHRYAQRFCAHETRKVKTPYGTFTVCADCATDCYQDYPQLQEN